MNVGVLFPVFALCTFRDFISMCLPYVSKSPSTDVSCELMTQKTKNEKFFGIGNVL